MHSDSEGIIFINHVFLRDLLARTARLLPLRKTWFTKIIPGTKSTSRHDWWQQYTILYQKTGPPHRLKKIRSCQSKRCVTFKDYVLRQKENIRSKASPMNNNLFHNIISLDITLICVLLSPKIQKVYAENGTLINISVLHFR